MGGPASLVFAPPNNCEHVGADIVSEAKAILVDLENRYSRYIDTSLVSLINERAGSKTPTVLDPETRGLLDFCSHLYRESDGLFDPTAGVLNQAWDFKRNQIPTDRVIETILPRVGWDKVSIDEAGITLQVPHSELDLGGIVKEYAADKVAALLRKTGVTKAIIELAGDIVTLGVKLDGQPWRVGVTDPNAPTQTALSVALTDACIATSGSSQRFIEINGQRYSHFLNPKTGHPVEGCFSVSVIADSCLIAGGLATIACLMGATKGKTWLASSGLPWLIIEESQWTGPISDHYSSEQSTEAPQRNVPSPR